MLTPKDIADTLSGILPSLGPLAGAIETQTRASPDTIAKVKLAMDGVTSGIAAIGSAESISAAMPTVQRVETDITAVLQAAATLPLPPPYNIILLIASGLAPTIFAAVNTAATQVHGAPAPAAPA
jgi:hypothetical protein